MTNNEITPPILDKDAINAIAERFLSEKGLEDKLPVPVEEIVEFGLKLDIIPFPGLQRDFDTDGFMAGDMSAIYVDEFIFNSRPTRYRFTLAHEIGHIVLHKDIISKIHPSSVADWPDFISNLDSYSYGWLEYQAYEFAGRLLVPRKHIVKHFHEKLITIDDKLKLIKSNNLPKSTYQEYVVEAIAKQLINIYDVSLDALSKRISKEIEAGNIKIP